MQAPIIKTTAANQAIIDAVVAQNFVIVDDHKSGKQTVTLGGVAVYSREEVQLIVALFTKEFSDYYTVNEIRLDAEGKPYVSRNACGGTIFGATDDVHADVKTNRESYDWKLIEEKPFLHPGFITHIVAPAGTFIADPV